MVNITKWINEWKKQSDSFGKQIRTNTRTIIDQPATSPTNRMRHRYYVDTGSGYNRVNNPIEDNSGSFTDAKNHYLISCPAGERREFRTAERATYQSGYEIEWGLAWRAVQNLGNDQVVRIILEDTPREDQIIAEYSKDSNGDLQGEFYLEQASGKTGGDAAGSFDVSGEDYTTPRISRGKSNFYGIGEHVLEEAVTNSVNKNVENVEQEINLKKVIGDPSNWSLESFNLHMAVEIDCRNASNGLDVEVGTMNYKVLGDSPETRRQIEFRKINQEYSGSDNYEPAYALRVDPERDNIPVQIPGTELVQPDGNAGELVLVAVFPDEVGFDGTDEWSVSEQAAENDSVMQVRDDVSQIVDGTGSLASNIPTINRNMRQISMSATTSRKATGDSTAETVQAPLHPDEVAVALILGDTTQTIQFDTRTISDENW